MQLKLLTTVGLVFFAISAFAQGTGGTGAAETKETSAHPVNQASQSLVQTSTEYPLNARIIAVEMHTGSHSSSSVSTDYEGKVSGEGSGGTYEWHLMKTVIGDKLYGLSVHGAPFHKRNWLEMGSYPAKRVKGGFEVQYSDKGKVHHEVLFINSEEPYPAQ
jgi:hypothetical protein